MRSWENSSVITSRDVEFLETIFPMKVSLDESCIKEEEIMKPKYVFEWFDVESEEDTQLTGDLQVPPVPAGNIRVGEVVSERDLVDDGMNQNTNIERMLQETLPQRKEQGRIAR